MLIKPLMWIRLELAKPFAIAKLSAVAAQDLKRKPSLARINALSVICRGSRNSARMAHNHDFSNLVDRGKHGNGC